MMWFEPYNSTNVHAIPLRLTEHGSGMRIHYNIIEIVLEIAATWAVVCSGGMEFSSLLIEFNSPSYFKFQSNDDKEFQFHLKS